MSFWPQVKNNGVFSAFPPNLVDPAQDADSAAEWLEKMLNETGFGFVAKLLQEEISSFTILDAFHIPSDADDSGCNMAMGGFLKQSSFDDLYKVWESRNHAASHLVHATLQVNTFFTCCFLRRKAVRVFSFCKRPKHNCHQSIGHSILLCISALL
jgi:hypothetical protein